MKLSARNQLPGRILAVEKGQTAARVKIGLGLVVGDQATAIVKASDVIIGK